MAFDEKLADRIRIALENVPNVEEKKMFRGLTFMVNGKMCISASGNEMMCRIDPEIQEEALSKIGCRPMEMKNKGTMKGFVYVNNEGFKTNRDFNYWIVKCLEYNKFAKASKKKK